MDEEFIGGTTLQGSCSSFRGKLCVWAHLLKVTPENSRVLVNRLVPKQAGAKGYDQIIESVESDSLGGKGGTAARQAESVGAQSQQVQAGNQRGDAQASTPQKDADSPQKKAQSARTEGMQKKKGQNAGQGPRAGSTGRAASAGRAASSGRAQSSSRGKQGAWKEAKGPSTKGVGFKGPGKRGPSTGLSRWKKLVGTKSGKPAKQTAQASPAPPSSNGAGQRAMELKAILGVETPSAPAPANPTPSLPTPSSVPSTAAGLKALLGVGGPPADEGLSLDQIPDPPMPPPEMMVQGPPPPATAAEKLFAMMRAKQPQGGMGHVYPGPPQPSSFNFTYVEEGKAPPPMPPPPQQMQQPMMMPPPHNYPMNTFNYGYPPPPPAHMMPPPPAHMHSPAAQLPSPGPSDVDFPPLGAPANRGPSDVDFPPLGAPDKSTKAKAPETQSSAPAAKPSVMVPAVVASKSKK